MLFAAPLFADLLWPVLVALRIEQVRIAGASRLRRHSNSSATRIRTPSSRLTLFGAAFGWAVHLSRAARRRPASRPVAPIAPIAPSSPLPPLSSCSCS